MSDAQAYALSDLVDRFSAEYKETHRSQPLEFTKEKGKENVVNKEKENERNNENENGVEDDEYPDDYDEGKMIR